MGDNQASRQIDIEGDGNVVGDHSQSHVVKTAITGNVTDSMVLSRSTLNISVFHAGGTASNMSIGCAKIGG
jgi:hypothetical protein